MFYTIISRVKFGSDFLSQENIAYVTSNIVMQQSLNGGRDWTNTLKMKKSEAQPDFLCSYKNKL